MVEHIVLADIPLSPGTGQWGRSKRRGHADQHDSGSPNAKRHNMK